MDLLRDRITFALAAGRLLSRALAAFAAAAALTLTAACGGGGGGGDSGGGGNTTPPDPQVRATIGAAGGEVAFADQRFKLTIPAGALGNPTEIVITELSAANVPAQLRPPGSSFVYYRLEPAGTQFAVPAQVQLRLAAGQAMAAMVLESNGAFEYPAGQRLSISADGRTLSGRIGHFSTLVVDDDMGLDLRLALSATRIEVGAELRADLTITAAADRIGAGMTRSSFLTDGDANALSSGPVAVTLHQPPPEITFELNQAYTLNGAYRAVCVDTGTGKVKYQAELGNVFLFIFSALFNDGSGRGEFELDIEVGYECVDRTGSIVPTGVRPVPNLTALDVAHVIRRTFGPFGQGGTAGVSGSSRAAPLASNPIDASSGALAVVAGAEGTVIVDLVSGQLLLDWTTAGPERDVLGSPAIGVLPITRPGANAPAALFGYRVNGSALRNYDPAMNAFGLIAIGLSPVFDATTVGGDAVADAFISVSPARGIEFYGFDEAARFYRGAFAPSLSAALFPGGTLLTAYRVAAGSAVLAATRGHDGNTTSRLWAHSGSGTQAATAIATLAAEARRVRCLAPVPASTTSLFLCGVTSASGSAAFFSFDPANALAPVTPLVVPTAAGTLGIALSRRANGNAYAVVANLSSDSLNLIELTPALGLVASTPIAAPAGCTRPAHPALLTDAEGDKAVVSCNGSSSLWIVRLFQPG